MAKTVTQFIHSDDILAKANFDKYIIAIGGFILLLALMALISRLYRVCKCRNFWFRVRVIFKLYGKSRICIGPYMFRSLSNEVELHAIS